MRLTDATADPGLAGMSERGLDRVRGWVEGRAGDTPYGCLIVRRGPAAVCDVARRCGSPRWSSAAGAGGSKREPRRPSERQNVKKISFPAVKREKNLGSP